jgi:hypothetical protein
MLTINVCCLGWRPWHVQTRSYCCWREPVRQFDLYEKKFGWMSGSWTQRMGSLWMKASATWGRAVILTEGLCHWGRQAVPLFQLYPGNFLQLRKSTENLSHGSRLILVNSYLRILNPSHTHNNFWYYYVFSVYHSPYNHRSTYFEFL